jgi:hypothetical protein
MVINKKKRVKKRAIAMSFNWLFAILAGGFILFLAIYGTVKIMEGGSNTDNTETAAKLAGILDPLGSGLASGKSASVNFNQDTKTYYRCESRSKFGDMSIAFSQRGIGDRYSEKGQFIDTNKYIFAEREIEGKKLYVYSKPFEMGFKIDDLIVISSKDYCFYQAPNEIKDEVKGLNIENIKLIDNLKNCTGTTVCFGSRTNCDISVYGMCENYNCDSKYDYGKVIKNKKEVYYVDSLMYGAIFSSNEIYECNIKRLMKRFVALSSVYMDKIKIIELKGCSSNIETDLTGMLAIARTINNSQGIYSMSQLTQTMDAKNSASICKLY